jgi:hypothetical protein
MMGVQYERALRIIADGGISPAIGFARRVLEGEDPRSALNAEIGKGKAPPGDRAIGLCPICLHPVTKGDDGQIVCTTGDPEHMEAYEGTEDWPNAPITACAVCAKLVPLMGTCTANHRPNLPPDPPCPDWELESTEILRRIRRWQREM